MVTKSLNRKPHKNLDSWTELYLTDHIWKYVTSFQATSGWIFCCLSPLAGRWDTNQCSPLSAPDQRAVEPSAPADASAPEDQWLAKGHWNHLTDQSLFLVFHQHVPLLHTRIGQVRKTRLFFSHYIHFVFCVYETFCDFARSAKVVWANGQLEMRGIYQADKYSDFLHCLYKCTFYTLWC